MQTAVNARLRNFFGYFISDEDIGEECVNILENWLRVWLTVEQMGLVNPFVSLNLMNATTVPVKSVPKWIRGLCQCLLRLWSNGFWLDLLPKSTWGRVSWLYRFMCTSWCWLLLKLWSWVWQELENCPCQEKFERFCDNSFSLFYVNLGKIWKTGCPNGCPACPNYECPVTTTVALQTTSAPKPKNSVLVLNTYENYNPPLLLNAAGSSDFDISFISTVTVSIKLAQWL